MLLFSCFKHLLQGEKLHYLQFSVLKKLGCVVKNLQQKIMTSFKVPCEMSHGGGGGQKSVKSVTHYLNGPFVLDTYIKLNAMLKTHT